VAAPPPYLTLEVRGVPVEFRESRRARRLRMEARPGSIRVTVPKGCPPDAVGRFVMGHAEWIAERARSWRELAPPGEGPVDPPFPDPGQDLDLNADSDPCTEGGATRHLVFRGRRTRFRTLLTAAARPRVAWEASRGLTVHLPDRWPAEDREPRGRRALRRWYDALLGEEADRIIWTEGAPRGLVPREVRFSQPRTRWGSCARNGIIRLNRRLVGAPAPVFRYVVLHEIAHLRHADHSPRFWGLVEELEPDWRTHRHWLREHGMALG
jgi:predicted metal-dependent hydrolase